MSKFLQDDEADNAKVMTIYQHFLEKEISSKKKDNKHLLTSQKYGTRHRNKKIHNNYSRFYTKA